MAKILLTVSLLFDLLVVFSFWFVQEPSEIDKIRTLISSALVPVIYGIIAILEEIEELKSAQKMPVKAYNPVVMVSEAAKYKNTGPVIQTNSPRT